MSGNRVLIDTNIVIYFLLGHKDVEKYFYSFNPVLSFVSELELISGKDFTSQELEVVRAFLSKQVVLGYIPAVKDIVIEIRSKKKIKLPDALIAATAMYFDIPLISSDKAFANIQGLNVIYHEPSTL